MKDQWYDKIFKAGSGDFDALALEIFHYQYENNRVYGDFVRALKIDPASVKSVHKIPFLPIRFFKSHEVKTGSYIAQTVFESSGTTGSISSKHFVKDLSLYEESFKRGFELFYGTVRNWCIIGLLPSYLERQNSSLVYMIDKLIHWNEHPQSGFYLDEFDKLAAILQELERQKQPVLLVGVTFALLDFAEKFSFPLKHTIIMETGGMKGRREEMIREEVHALLKKSFTLNTIHSEYGMTELLSQAYSKGEGIFTCPPWMKILIRDVEDPLVSVPRFGTMAPVTGTINVIDLANIHSCCFIATDDVGKLIDDGSFEVMGRVDGSDLRGCSLMLI
ncbi:MAG: acyl transferase [Sphingobacteriales bacterium]|nr:acyl transferase [Sphingobacteriales bacterium]